jgi:hypothetical protein
VQFCSKRQGSQNTLSERCFHNGVQYEIGLRFAGWCLILGDKISEVWAEHLMLQNWLEVAHMPNPVCRKVEVDLSGILVRPQKLDLGVGDALEYGGTFSKPTDWAIDPTATRISPSGWININFFAVSCLIAFFCTVFIHENFEYSRRIAHLPSDAADLRPVFNSTTSRELDLEPSRLGTDVQLDQTKMNRIKENAAYSNQSPAVSTSLPHSEGQALALSRNTSGIADGASGDNSSSARSDNAGPGIRSRTTSSNSESASSGERTTSDHSSVRQFSRNLRRSILSSRTRISTSSRQSARRSLVNRVANLGVGKSTQQTTRQTVSGLKFGNHNGQSNASKTQAAADRTVMSMHSMQGGMGLGQSHGAMNPMRMESGMLAQPAMGAGLGGISGNGLGGGGNHGGNARR